jgi:hypothetical protein
LSRPWAEFPGISVGNSLGVICKYEAHLAPHIPGVLNGVHIPGVLNGVHIPGVLNGVHIPGVLNGVHIIVCVTLDVTLGVTLGVIVL